VTTSPEPFAAAALAACTAAVKSADDSDDRRLQSMLPRRHQHRQRIIVLSPDAPEALLEAPSIYDVYVVGGLCDYKRIANATLDRAGGLLRTSTPPMLNLLLLLLLLLCASV